MLLHVTPHLSSLGVRTPPSYLWGWSLSLNLDLTDVGRLVGQQAPALPPKCWDSRLMLPCLDFYMALRIQTQVPVPVQQAFYHLSAPG